MTLWNALACVMLPLSGVLLYAAWRLLASADESLEEAREHLAHAEILTGDCRDSLDRSIPKAYVNLKVVEWRNAIATVGERDGDAQLVVDDFASLLGVSTTPEPEVGP